MTKIDWNREISTKPFSHALRKALLAPADARGIRQIDKLAEALVRAAVNGDIAAIKLIAERTEGKPDQKRITEHELSISQQLLAALRSVADAPKAKVIDGKVMAIEELQQDVQQHEPGAAATRTRANAPADIAPAIPARRNSGDLVTAARRLQRK